MLIKIIKDKNESLYLLNDKKEVFGIGDSVITLSEENSREGIILKLFEESTNFHYALVEFPDRQRFCRLNAIQKK